MNMRKASIVCGLWVAAALLFNAGIYVVQGPSKALDFLTGYLIELSLSVDNVFVFLVIFSHFKVPLPQQSTILFWGILGAQVMRAVLIFTGVALLSKFHWLVYVLGLFLILTGLKVFSQKEQLAVEDSRILKFCQKLFPKLSKFWIVLLVIEFTDLVFALDSVPAVLAITTDPFIVWTSNIFAILGLRSMYFVLAGVMPLFHYLHYALGVILVFVGLKMLLEHYISIPNLWALAFTASTLLICVLFSWRFPPKKV